jgi:iron-sulfur cluster assembly accessory protein
MLTITEKAQGKVKEILESQPEPYAGLRVQIVGGGCSGFQYQMGFEKQANTGDEIVELNGFKVFVDKGSSIYLDGTEIDFVEALTGSGFKFINPNVKSTCGCGESFQV